MTSFKHRRSKLLAAVKATVLMIL